MNTLREEGLSPSLCAACEGSAAQAASDFAGLGAVVGSASGLVVKPGAGVSVVPGTLFAAGVLVVAVDVVAAEAG